MSKISVITAFYNGNQYINKLLHSIQNNIQICKENGIFVESIIVNDSPDSVVKYDKFIYDFSITVVNNPKNMGIHASRINGIKKAAGEFIIMLDQDDLLTEESIYSQMNAIGSADVCVGNGIQVLDKGENKIFKNIKYHSYVMNLDVFLKFGTPIISPGQCLIRKSSIPEIWLNNLIKTNGADDEILWILMLLNKCRFVINSVDVYHHISTGINTSNNFDKMAASSLEGGKLLAMQGFITKAQRDVFVRRRKMKKERYGKSVISRLLINIKYLDLSLFVVRVKLLQAQSGS